MVNLILNSLGVNNFRGLSYNHMNCLHADGVNDYVSLSTVSFGAGFTALSFACWAKANASTITTTARLFWAWNATFTSGWQVSLFGTNNLGVVISNAGVTYGQCAIASPNQWHHYGFVFNGSLVGNSNRLKIYVDGVLMTLSFTGTIPIYIGASGEVCGMFRKGASSADYFGGSLDEVAIWNDADDNHIINHYNAGIGADADVSNLIRYYKMNSINPSTVCIDETGNDNGSLVNFSFTGGSEWEAH